MRDKSIHISYCYSSPALRCVQTASKILEGLQIQNKIKIRLEFLFVLQPSFSFSRSSGLNQVYSNVLVGTQPMKPAMF